jgi:hypothetical protein
MDKAKAAVSGLLSKAGHHDTEVHERVAPAVEHKTINPHQREERQIAVDREVHQDHYHTTVQPVLDREVLPEQHHANIVPIEHRTHDKRDTRDTEQFLAQTKAQFKSEQVRTDTKHTATELPSVAGEHTHHHIHETIQPVIQKEVIEPHVVHTTVPIHEVHHKQAQHHSATALPAVSIDEFKKGGGALTGREERVDHFQGTPKNLESSLGGHHSGSGLTGSHGTTGIGSGLTGSHGTQNTASHLPSTHNTATGTKGGLIDDDHSARTTGAGVGSSHSSTSSSNSSTKHKPSLMDKLNPKVDANGDGKAGFMK